MFNFKIRLNVINLFNYLSDKYPSLSPYIYSANNPVVLVDPNGEKVYIVGDAADEATGYLSTNNIKVTRNSETGELSYEGKAKNNNEKLLVKAIEDEKIDVNVTANKSANIIYEGEPYDAQFGGSFLGNELEFDENGNTKGVNTNQYISMDRLKENFKPGQIKKVIYHEITESYFGGLISLNTGKKATPAFRGGENDIYNMADQMATSCPMPLYPYKYSNSINNESNNNSPYNQFLKFSQPPYEKRPSISDIINNN